ncbi:MAG: hypothetical protein NW220_18685 [Leptolyngbyaceae cyanobacterium bins.349]|nr:hypothetical protein [Leptolyngbyaceae cyanobacterium bins.349]
MARQLKRWESPRREGRNDKGRGGSARQRQRRKQFQALRQKLKDQSKDSSDANSNQTQPGKHFCFPSFLDHSTRCATKFLPGKSRRRMLEVQPL